MIYITDNYSSIEQEQNSPAFHASFVIRLDFLNIRISTFSFQSSTCRYTIEPKKDIIKLKFDEELLEVQDNKGL